MTHHTASRRRKGGMKPMAGGMTTGEHGITVYGNTNQQSAIGNGSNVIRVNDPNAMVPTEDATTMQGGRRHRAHKQRGGFWSSFANLLGNKHNEANPTESANPTNTDANPTNTDANPTNTDANPTNTDANPTNTGSSAPNGGSSCRTVGGKKKRKSAKKHRKSSKKGKTAKKRAHKRR